MKKKIRQINLFHFFMKFYKIDTTNFLFFNLLSYDI